MKIPKIKFETCTNYDDSIINTGIGWTVHSRDLVPYLGITIELRLLDNVVRITLVNDAKTYNEFWNVRAFSRKRSAEKLSTKREAKK